MLLQGSMTSSALLLFFLTFTVSHGTEVWTVTPEKGTTLNIKNSRVNECMVCAVSQNSTLQYSCGPTLSLKDSTPVSLKFKCLKTEGVKLQDVFSVEILRNIECDTTSCNGHISHKDSSDKSLEGFNRTFTWTINTNAPKKRGSFKIDFSYSGLRQINPSETCGEDPSYVVEALGTSVAVGRYCHRGLIRSAQINEHGKFSVVYPAGKKLKSVQFDLSGKEKIQSLAKISVTLPVVVSSLEMFSPNYPDSFPDNGVMEWFFQVPERRKAIVHFLKLTRPNCKKNGAKVEYHSNGKLLSVETLTNCQPTQNLRNFSLTLKNCEMERKGVGSSGLAVKFKVSASVILPSIRCEVDGRSDGVSLHVSKTRPSDCVMKINGVKHETITVTSHANLSFHDCIPEEVQVSATKLIGCHTLTDCPKTPVNLLLPTLPPCLPAPLSRMTWTLQPGKQGTVQLTSPKGPLKQSLPGQICNSSVVFKLAEEDGASIGHFCAKGTIKAVHIHSNMSITWESSTGKELLKTYSKQVLLSASFKKEIPERYIFNVSTEKNSPILVATPGWPVGMKSYSTVSWIVFVPSGMEAHVLFTNLSQPKCSNRHTSIKVRRFSSTEEEYSRREDEMPKRELTVSESFYLNMSNCMPERGNFSVMVNITLRKAMNRPLIIGLSVLAVLLVICFIVLVAVCLVIRKKKKKLSHQVSIYNPNGTNFLPGQNNVSNHEDDESHLYASIDESLIYSDLLKKGAEMGLYKEYNVYESVQRQTDSHKPLVTKDNMGVGSYQLFQVPSQNAPMLPSRPPSHVQTLVVNEHYQSGDELNLKPQLAPEDRN
ncbi:CUB domain-containing protein 1a [Pholidichthys leucotaenia]